MSSETPQNLKKVKDELDKIAVSSSTPITDIKKHISDLNKKGGDVDLTYLELEEAKRRSNVLIDAINDGY